MLEESDGIICCTGVKSAGDVRLIISRLRRANVPPVQGWYRIYVDMDSEKALLSDPEFRCLTQDIAPNEGAFAHLHGADWIQGVPPPGTRTVSMKELATKL